MERIQVHLLGNSITSNSADAHSLYEKSSFGEKLGDKIQYSSVETLYLVEKKKTVVYTGSSNKILSEKELAEKFEKLDKKFSNKYVVFKDLRDRGYVVKTALKFGADFRVYEKGVRPGRDRKDTKHEHAKWVCFVDHESGKLTWHDFSAKNRVAHSTKKNLLLAIVDEENSVTYYEVNWIRT
ncbi:tRNA-intron lyase [Candidatus Pacearchaeota archaeon CG10_big_fil_rev_8_21_14_0_10_32_14]|nr:MAG: tRNA-intron lyase [Candidatus Pacearchaeota archaeon CG10_big_fil_rev_8_21_14_0_10_32_14]